MFENGTSPLTKSKMYLTFKLPRFFKNCKLKFKGLSNFR